MKISFCTTCSNRLYQFEKTIDSTYEIVKNNPDTEWVIVNYGSKDNLHQFMLDRLENMSNRVVYVNEISGRQWHASYAKNAAHIIATGDVLLNLDCDNFIGTSLDIIRNKFYSGVEILQMWTGIPKDGTFGRIAITKNLFYKLNGYDERLYQMSGQDSDLFRRAVGVGAKWEKCISPEFKAIQNTKEESIKHIQTFGMSWDEIAKKSRKIIDSNIKNKKFVANLPKGMFVPKYESYKGKILQ